MRPPAGAWIVDRPGARLTGGDADYAAGNALAAVAVDEAELVAAAAEVVLGQLEEHRSPDDRVRPDELHEPVLLPRPDEARGRGKQREGDKLHHCTSPLPPSPAHSRAT